MKIANLNSFLIITITPFLGPQAPTVKINLIIYNTYSSKCNFIWKKKTRKWYKTKEEKKVMVIVQERK